MSTAIFVTAGIATVVGAIATSLAASGEFSGQTLAIVMGCGAGASALTTYLAGRDARSANEKARALDVP